MSHAYKDLSRVVATAIIVVAIGNNANAIDYTHDQLQYQSVATKSGAYNFGYDTGVFGAHSFHQQWRDEDGEVRGRYGYTDPNGDLRITHYKAGKNGYQILSDKVEPGNPVRAGPRPPPGSGDSLVVPGAGVVSRRLPADVAARPVASPQPEEEVTNYRNALVAYPKTRDDYVVGKTKYYIPYRQAGQLGRPVALQRPVPTQLSKFDRYYKRSPPAEFYLNRPYSDNSPRRVYYKDGRPLSYNPFEVYAQRARLGHNPFAA